MIGYFHPTNHTPPEWIRGAVGLSRVMTADGCAFGICDGFMLAIPKEGRIQLSGGWQAWLIPGFDPIGLVRVQSWLPINLIKDREGKTWPCPVVLSEGGERNFNVSFDENWMPALTDSQKTLMETATAARAALAATYPSDASKRVANALSMAAGCAWLARCLSEACHVTPEVLGKLHLIDDFMVIAGLEMVTGYTIPESYHG